MGLKERSDFSVWNFIHRSIGLLIINKEWEVLICKRPSNKKQEPWVYSHSVDWCVGDESYKSSVKRELQEELWISWEVTEIYKFYFWKTWNKMRKTVYVCRTNKSIHPDEIEVAETLRIKRADLISNIKRNPENYAESFLKSIEICNKLINDWKISL